MKKLLLLSILIACNCTFSQMLIDESQDAQQLITDGLIGNPNFVVTNVIESTGTNFGGVNGIGAFSFADEFPENVNFPFMQGIVLSSGSVAVIPGSNTSDLNSGGPNWPGDVDLTNLIGVNTNNASSLQFDFIADVSMISFDFIMASEEYNGSAFECTYADIFSFILINNVNGVSENLALVPGTNQPIAVTTVHPENNSCPASNEDYFGGYNDANVYPLPVTNFNGQTVAFCISKTLSIGTSYTLKIVIADGTDTVFDSALFVRNSSFGAFPVIETPPTDLVVADEDDNGFSEFNLRSNESQMLGSIDVAKYSFDFSYYLTLADAEAGMNAITMPEAFVNTTNPQEIFLRMFNTYTGTAITDSFQIATNEDVLNVDGLQANEFNLYPNPVEDYLHIDNADLKLKAIEIYAINGQLIFSQTFSTERNATIDFSNLDEGMYVVKLVSEEGSSFKKVLK